MNQAASQRIQAAKTWYDSRGADRPEWSDVELLAVLAPTRSSVGELILRDRDRLLAAYDELDRLWAEGPKAEPEMPQSDPARAPRARRAVVTESDERFERLRRWHSDASAEGRSNQVRDLDDAALSLIAKSKAVSAAQVRKIVLPAEARRAVQKLASELVDVLAGAPEPGTRTVASAGTEAAVAGSPRPSSRRGAAAPASAPTPETPVRSGPTGLTGFAAFDYGVAASAHSPVKIEFTPADDARLLLRWAAAPQAPVTIYRVVASPEFLPDFSPDVGRQVAATFDTEMHDVFDVAGLAEPVRQVVVWAYQGDSEDQARQAHPVVHATGACVLPVRRCQIRADGKAVVGQWDSAPGISRIDVLRFPVAEADLHQHYDPARRINGSVQSGGFTDWEAQPGQEYEYRIYALAATGEGQAETMSPPVVNRVTISANPEPVRDLAVAESPGQHRAFDLTWTPPAVGKVEIYRTQKVPAPELTARSLDRSAIIRGGLTRDSEVVGPRSEIGGAMEMRSVAWPGGSAKAYITPVTVVSEDQILVGAWQILTMPLPFEKVRLIERVDEQVLTFSWPEGTATAKIFVGGRNSPFLSPMAESAPFLEISADNYVKFGGAHLPHPLPSEGCAVHLVAASYSKGQAVLAEAVTIDYPGLTRLRYRIEPVPEQQKFRLRRGPVAPSLNQLFVESDVDMPAVELLLVHNRNRLPLHRNDGTVFGREQMDVGRGPRPAGREFAMPDPRGFLRLFVDALAADDHKVAIIDPPLRQLRCD